MNGNTLPKFDFVHHEDFTRHDEIECLMEKINKLIPVSDSLVRLIKLRAVDSIGTSVKSNRRRRTTPYFTQLKSDNEVAFEPLLDLAASVNSDCLEECRKRLHDFLCNSVIEDINARKQLIEIKSKVDLIHRRLTSLFNDSTLPISIRGEVIQIYLSKIGHSELRKEADSNYEIIKMLLKSINCFLHEDRSDEDLDRGDKTSVRIHTMELLDLDVLDKRADAVIGAMIAVELRRLQVEQLVCKDRNRRIKTVSKVSIYILVIAILVIILPLITTIFPKLSFFEFLEINNLSEKPLSHRIQFLGIPASVIIWSFIGSFAATIHRFNRKSVYSFDEAVKWMLTRHIQGIVLSCAFYLVLVSGLFLISNSDSTQPSTKDEVILVLSFLIGFSDRFVDSVFNTLIERYSGKSPEPNANRDDQASE